MACRRFIANLAVSKTNLSGARSLPSLSAVRQYSRVSKEEEIKTVTHTGQVHYSNQLLCKPQKFANRIKQAEKKLFCY